MQILNWFVNWSMDQTGADHGAISMFLFIVPTNSQHLPVVELHTNGFDVFQWQRTSAADPELFFHKGGGVEVISIYRGLVVKKNWENCLFNHVLNMNNLNNQSKV